MNMRTVRIEDIIISKSYDIKFCKCGAVAVDGDLDYLRSYGILADFTGLSECEQADAFNLMRNCVVNV